ncbi:MAG: hypothetical protein ACKVUT_00675 [Gaiella sp.]
MKRTPSAGLGSVATGAVTALALAVQTGLAAVVGVIIAREFGRTTVTDGFFAAYGVFVVLALAATASRLVLVPCLARAQLGGRLRAEAAAHAVALTLVALPVLVMGVLVAGPVAALLTGFGRAGARGAAAEVLPWMVVAGVCQLFAGLAASALAALDDYVTAAAGFIAGSVAGLGVILVAVDAHGIAAVSWGMAVNGVVALAVPTLVFAARARGGPAATGGQHMSPGRRLRELGEGVSFPLALQAVYLLSMPFAARGGVGAVTTLGYAYLAASAVIAVTASSLGLVTSAPLARLRPAPGTLARHIVASSWPALLACGATAGLFAVAGETLTSTVLGTAYDAAVGSELGRLVAALAPWMVVTIVLSVALPLVFVAERGGRLPLLAGAMIGVHVPLVWAGEAVFGLPGVAAALAVSTNVGLVGLLLVIGGGGVVGRGVAKASLVVGLFVLASFGLSRLALGGGPSAGLVGVGIYLASLLLFRPRPLREALAHLRSVE